MARTNAQGRLLSFWVGCACPWAYYMAPWALYIPRLVKCRLTCPGDLAGDRMHLAKASANLPGLTRDKPPNPKCKSKMQKQHGTLLVLRARVAGWGLALALAACEHGHVPSFECGLLTDSHGPLSFIQRSVLFIGTSSRHAQNALLLLLGQIVITTLWGLLTLTVTTHHQPRSQQQRRKLQTRHDYGH